MNTRLSCISEIAAKTDLTASLGDVYGVRKSISNNLGRAPVPNTEGTNSVPKLIPMYGEQHDRVCP